MQLAKVLLNCCNIEVRKMQIAFYSYQIGVCQLLGRPSLLQGEVMATPTAAGEEEASATIGADPADTATDP